MILLNVHVTIQIIAVVNYVPVVSSRLSLTH